MYVCILHVARYTRVYAFVFENIWPGVLVYIHFVLFAYALNKYACNTAYISPNALLLFPTYRLLIYVKKTNVIFYLACYNHICTKTSILLKRHIWQIWKLPIVQIQASISVTFTLYELTAVNNVTRNTYSSHYWHMSMNKYTCHMAHACPTACLLFSMHRSNITAHISKINTKMQL